MQLGILVNNVAVTHTRCLSTKQAPTVLVENDLCVQDRPGQRGPLSIIMKPSTHKRPIVSSVLAVSPAHLVTLCHMLELTLTLWLH